MLKEMSVETQFEQVVKQVAGWPEKQRRRLAYHVLQLEGDLFERQSVVDRGVSKPRKRSLEEVMAIMPTDFVAPSDEAVAAILLEERLKRSGMGANS